MNLVSVIIVTWNSQEFIRGCLDSVFNQTHDEIEVILVDNGSYDHTLDIARAFLPRIKIVENKENFGFCRANNQALKLAKGGFILTLNSDIVLDRDYIRNLKDSLTKNPKAGMAQGKFLRLDGKTIDGIGLYLSCNRRFFNLGEGKKDGSYFGNDREIFGPCAAAALYKRELVEDIAADGEFFDDKFFFLAEDFDIAWRARNRGWKAIYAAQAFCFHYRNSSGHKSSFRQYLSFRNRYLMIIKNEKLWKFAVFFPVLLFYDVPRFIFLLFKNPYALKAVREIIELLPELNKKRNLTLREK